MRVGRIVEAVDCIVDDRTLEQFTHFHYVRHIREDSRLANDLDNRMKRAADAAS